MIFKNSTPFETSDANELFKKLLSTTSVTNREYNRNGFFLSTVWRASKLYSIDSCIIFVIRAGEKEGGRGAPIFFYFTARNGSDKLSRRISLDPERAIKMLSLFIYPSFFFLFFHSVLFCFVLFCFVSFFFFYFSRSLSISNLRTNRFSFAAKNDITSYYAFEGFIDERGLSKCKYISGLCVCNDYACLFARNICGNKAAVTFG